MVNSLSRRVQFETEDKSNDYIDPRPVTFRRSALTTPLQHTLIHITDIWVRVGIWRPVAIFISGGVDAKLPARH